MQNFYILPTVSKSCGFCQVDAKPVLPALIPTYYFSRGMAKLFLGIAFINICVAGKTSPQTVAKKHGNAVLLRNLIADACIQHGFLDQQCDVLIRKTYVEGALIIICYPPEDGSKVDLGKIQPWF